MMAQHYKIYFVLLIVIFLSSNTCYAQGLFEEGGGTGTDFSLVSALLPLLLLGLLAAATPTATAAQAAQAAQAAPAAPAAVPVMVLPVAPPQTVTVLVPAATTQCVPETCPAGFMLLPNQGVSTTCYSDSGADVANDRSWNAALTDCTSTPGAHLWRPNTEQEADAVRNKYTIPAGESTWTGANLNADGTFRFAIENGLLDFANLPFGTVPGGVVDGTPFTDCVGLMFTAGGMWEWRDQLCTNTLRYICEYPRRVCP